MSKENFIGSKFGNLVVLSFDAGLRPNGKRKLIAICQCECGNKISVEKYNLTTGNTTRCSVCAIASRAESRKTHGHSISRKEKDPIGYSCYSRWQAIKRRCLKEYDSRYSDYGGRGIEICERWVNSYENFLADMGLPPTKNHQIDRIDNDGNYEPNNCRWVTRKTNARNKRNSKIITAFGKSMTQAEWANQTGIKRETISMRLRRGWSAELALSKK